jgi:hypothetical protein
VHALRRRSSLTTWGAAGLLLIVAALARLDTLRQPLVEYHSFRQTQTAFTTVEFDRLGIDLLHPRVPVLGKPFVLPFEFPLFQALAVLPMKLGLSADVSMRLTGLACFLLTALLLFGFLRFMTANLVIAFGALVAFLFSPFGLVWSRASLIEYLATAAAIGFAWSGIAWHRSRRPLLGVVAVLAGAVAMAVKIATGLFWILPVLAVVLPASTGSRPAGSRAVRAWTQVRAQLRTWLDPWLLVVVGIPVAAGLAWSRYADHVKGETFSTQWLRNGQLTDWYFGTVGQRLDGDRWMTIIDRAQTLIVGRYLWPPLVVVALLAVRRDRFWLAMLATAVLPVAVFFNVYWVHDYYLAAITPSLAALIGLAADWCWNNVPRHWPKAVVALGLVVAWAVPAYWFSGDYWKVPYRSVASAQLDGGLELHAVTSRDDLVVVQYPDWDPTTLYYARRRGLMLDPRAVNSRILRSLPRQGYDAWFAYDPVGAAIEEMRRWPWVAPAAGHTYLLGSTPQFRRVAVVALTGGRSGRSTAVPIPAGETLAPSIEVPCSGAAVEIPRGSTATWGVLESPPVPGLRLYLSDSPAPLPWVRAFVATDRAAGAPLTLRCSGAEAVRLRVVDAPAPGS